jgi:hypothetical protein
MELGNPYILNWFSKEAPRLIIHTRTSAVMQMGVKFKTTNNFDFFLRVSCQSKNPHQKWFEKYSRQYHTKRTPQISCFKGILKGHFYYL